MAVSNYFRLITTTIGKVRHYEEIKSHLLQKNKLSPDDFLFFEEMLCEVQQANYHSYKTSFFFDQKVSEGSFHLLKGKCINFLERVIAKVSEWSLDYLNSTFLFYYIIPFDPIMTKVCFTQPAYSLKNEEVFLLQTKSNMFNLFLNDSFLFANTKRIAINDYNEDRYEMFYLTNSQVLEILEEKTVSAIGDHISRNYFKRNDFLINFFTNAQEVDLILQRTL